jgi:hypothetical protein
MSSRDTYLMEVTQEKPLIGKVLPSKVITGDLSQRAVVTCPTETDYPHFGSMAVDAVAESSRSGPRGASVRAR